MIGLDHISLVFKDFWGGIYAGVVWIVKNPEWAYVLRVRGWILNFCSIRALTKAKCETVLQFHNEFEKLTGRN